MAYVVVVVVEVVVVGFVLHEISECRDWSKGQVGLTWLWLW